MLLPDGHDADAFRGLALDNFNIAYGASFGPYAKKYFRIGHLGDINDGTLIGALADHRNGAGARRHSAQEGRRAGGDGLCGVGLRRRRQGGGRVIAPPSFGWPAEKPEPGTTVYVSGTAAM